MQIAVDVTRHEGWQVVRVAARPEPDRGMHAEQPWPGLPHPHRPDRPVQMRSGYPFPRRQPGPPGGRIQATRGGGGDDLLTGGTDQDELSGGNGADFLSGGPGSDTVSYADADAAVEASLDGLAGNDGEAGEGDTIAGDVEHLTGGPGPDALVGNAAANELHGADGSDTLLGFDGNDYLFGGAGDDNLHGGASGDYMDGGADGAYGDSVMYNGRVEPLSITLNDRIGDDDAAGEGDSIGVENATGGSGGDWSVGTQAANRLDGGSGDDAISGLGDDDIWGGLGNDWLDDGPGNDVCAGAEGADHIPTGPTDCVD